MKKIYLTIAIILVLVALSVYGCSSTTTITNIPYTPPPASTTLPPAPTLISITVTPSYPPNLTVGYTQQFTATAIYSDGSTSDITSQVTWNSSNANAATFVTSSGLVEGISAGVVNITAAFPGFVSAPISLTVIPPNTPVPTTNPGTTWSTSSSVINGGYSDYFPLNGAYIQVNGTKTLTMSWSADGGLDCFILTENQFNNFKNDLFGIVSAWMASGSGSNGTITAVIQNTDTYYVVLRNTFAFGPSVKLYQATLTAQ